MRKKIILFTFFLSLLVLVFYQAGQSSSIEHIPLWTHQFPKYEGARKMVISADGQYVAAIGSELFLFSRDKNVPLWRYDPYDGIHEVAISADGQYIVIGTGNGLDGHVYLFTKDQSTPVWISTVEDRFEAVDISADGQYIIAGGWKNMTYLFNRASSSPILNFSIEYKCTSVDISADGTFIAVGIGGDWDHDLGAVCLFNNTNPLPLWNYSITEVPGGRDVRDVAISADGQYIAACIDNSRIYLFNQTGPTPMRTYNHGVYLLSISTDGQYFAASALRRVYLFNRSSPAQLWNYTFSGVDGSTNRETLAMSANGQYIAAAGGNHAAVFNHSSSIPLWNYSTPSNIPGLAISADGNYTALISYGDNGNTFYLFHLTQKGPMVFPWEWPLYLTILLLVGIFLAAQYGLYRLLGKYSWEETHKENVVYALSTLFVGSISLLLLQEIPFYDELSPLILPIQAGLFIILGGILTLLAFLKKLPTYSRYGQQRTYLIFYYCLAIAFVTMFGIFSVTGTTSSYYLLPYVFLLWIFPLFYTWVYLKEKLQKSPE